VHLLIQRHNDPCMKMVRLCSGQFSPFMALLTLEMQVIYFFRKAIMQRCRSNKTLYRQGLWCYTWVWWFSPVLNYIFSISSLIPFSFPLLCFTAFQLLVLQGFFPLCFLLISFPLSLSGFHGPCISFPASCSILSPPSKKLQDLIALFS